MTVKTKITLLIVGTGFIASLVFSVVVFFELIEQPFELLDAILEEEAYSATCMAAKKKKIIKSVHIDSEPYEKNTYWIEIYEQGVNMRIYQSNLAKLVKLSPVTPGSSAIVNAAMPLEKFKFRTGNSQKKMTFRIRTFVFLLGDKTFTAQIARPMEKLDEEIWELVIGIVSGLIFSTLALISISRFVAGKILKPIGVIKDLAKEISEKNLEQRIPIEKWQDEFGELAWTINQMLDRLQYSFIKQRNFLFDTSHELKTPLTTMRLAIDQICYGSKKKLPSFLEKSLFRLNNQVLRMEHLVKDLLKLSSLETLTGINPKPIDIAELMKHLVAEYKLLADTHNIKIDMSFPYKFVAQGDEEKLKRMFSNIIDNALKYNENGGSVEVLGERSGNDLMIAVTNTGPGVAKDEIAKVFEQFYRVEKSRSPRYGGFGLGLSIAKRIVELHKGAIKFESQQDAWTRVTVCLFEHHSSARCPVPGCPGTGHNKYLI